MATQDNDAFKKLISFVLKPSAAGAENVKGVMKKHGRGSKTKARRNRRMSSMVGQS